MGLSQRCMTNHVWEGLQPTVVESHGFEEVRTSVVPELGDKGPKVPEFYAYEAFSRSVTT